MNVQRLTSENLCINNLDTSAQIITKIDKNLYKKLFIDYFDNQQHANLLSKKYNICSKKIKYEMYKSGFTQKTYLRHKYSKKYIEELLKFNTYEKVANLLNISLGKFRGLTKYLGIKRDTSTFYLKNKINKDFFKNEKFKKEFYYYLGLFVTDGCFTKNSCKIVIKNKNSYELLSEIAKKAGHNNVRRFKNDFNSLTFTSKELVETVVKLGVPYKNKTYGTKQIYIKDKECLLSFMCGCLDGDGSVGSSTSKFGHKTSLKFRLVNYNIEFLYFLQTELKKIGYNSVVKKHKNSIPELTIGTRNKSKEFFKEMYETSPFYLKSKYDIYKSIK